MKWASALGVLLCRNSLRCCTGTFKWNSFSGSLSGCQVVVASFILDLFFSCMSCHISHLVPHTFSSLHGDSLPFFSDYFLLCRVNLPSSMFYSKSATSPIFASLLSVLQLVFHVFLFAISPFFILDSWIDSMFFCSCHGHLSQTLILFLGKFLLFKFFVFFPSCLFVLNVV